jgi:hypothetical protein
MGLDIKFNYLYQFKVFWWSIYDQCQCTGQDPDFLLNSDKHTISINHLSKLEKISDNFYSKRSDFQDYCHTFALQDKSG